jgi:Xaa-Pro aminopeptidase
MIKMQDFSDEELQNFRRYQRLSYQILEDTALSLKVGDSEESTARKLRKAFHKAGAHNYFHVPVALFGERSAYPGDFGPFEALATARVLQEQDTVILDAAPIFDGYTVDTSHAFNFGNSEAFDRIDRELPILRDLIARSVNDGEMFQQIAWDVDDYIRERGFENCHRKHIGAVLGHLVTKATSQRLASWSYKGLAVKQVSWFLARSRFSGTTPNWNHTNACKGVAPHGLWAVEPHLAEGKVGAKFEEILIIDEDGARWLDDDLPHHRRWAKFRPSA